MVAFAVSALFVAALPVSAQQTTGIFQHAVDKANADTAFLVSGMVEGQAPPPGGGGGSQGFGVGVKGGDVIECPLHGFQNSFHQLLQSLQPQAQAVDCVVRCCCPSGRCPVFGAGGDGGPFFSGGDCLGGIPEHFSLSGRAGLLGIWAE